MYLILIHTIWPKKQLTFYLTVKKQIVNNVYTDAYATCIVWKWEVGVKNSSYNQKKTDCSLHPKSTTNPNPFLSHMSFVEGILGWTVSLAFPVKLTSSHAFSNLLLIVPNSIYLRFFSVQMSSNETYSRKITAKPWSSHCWLSSQVFLHILILSEKIFVLW